MSKYDIEEYFKHLEIPEEPWKDVVAFREWYMDSKMPFIPPWDTEVICSDDATAICMFRHKQFQVELYLVHPNMPIPLHCHPGMESQIVHLGAGGTEKSNTSLILSQWGTIYPVLKPGEFHGARELGVFTKGYAMLTFEKFPDGVEPTSAAVLWAGETAGPKQNELIRKYYPDSDVTDERAIAVFNTGATTVE